MDDALGLTHVLAGMPCCVRTCETCHNNGSFAALSSACSVCIRPTLALQSLTEIRTRSSEGTGAYFVESAVENVFN